MNPNEAGSTLKKLSDSLREEMVKVVSNFVSSQPQQKKEVASQLYDDMETILGDPIYQISDFSMRENGMDSLRRFTDDYYKLYDSYEGQADAFYQQENILSYALQSSKNPEKFLTRVYNVQKRIFAPSTPNHEWQCGIWIVYDLPSLLARHSKDDKYNRSSVKISNYYNKNTNYSMKLRNWPLLLKRLKQHPSWKLFRHGDLVYFADEIDVSIEFAMIPDVRRFNDHS